MESKRSKLAIMLCLGFAGMAILATDAEAWRGRHHHGSYGSYGSYGSSGYRAVRYYNSGGSYGSYGSYGSAGGYRD